jgi:hypothetical protein
MGKQADELVNAMNRAAEAAVPQAKALLVNSIKQMSVQDAKAILTGGEDSGDAVLPRTTPAPLTEKFKPVVKQAMAKVKLAEKYDRSPARPPSSAWCASRTRNWKTTSRRRRSTAST